MSAAETENIREVLRFALLVIDTLEADGKGLRIELVFLRAKARKALGLPLEVES